MRILIPAAAIAAVLCVGSVSAQRRPDLEGMWTTNTATPLQRPDEFKDKVYFTPQEAAEWERTGMERLRKSIPEADLDAAPDVNDIYIETSAFKVTPDRRTALIVEPSDGKLPAQLPQARERAAKRPKRDFDDPETLTLDERCLISAQGGGSNAVPPLVPNPFASNFYQIVQTRDHVVVHTELIHDARIIRLGGTHPSPAKQFWLGDSVGHWEGGTLVVDTTNFTPKTHYRGSGERLHVVERFTRTDASTIRYRVTVEDPDTWAAPWTAEIPFKATASRIVEYACHEGNRDIENFMRGARAEEKK